MGLRSGRAAKRLASQLITGERLLTRNGRRPRQTTRAARCEGEGEAGYSVPPRSASQTVLRVQHSHVIEQLHLPPPRRRGRTVSWQSRVPPTSWPMFEPESPRLCDHMPQLGNARVQ